MKELVTTQQHLYVPSKPQTPLWIVLAMDLRPEVQIGLPTIADATPTEIPARRPPISKQFPNLQIRKRPLQLVSFFPSLISSMQGSLPLVKKALGYQPFLIFIHQIGHRPPSTRRTKQGG